MTNQFPFDIKVLFILFIFGSTILLTSCNKGLPLSCYDPVFYQKHKNDGCTADCPGVTGCDGKMYCNVCGMHANGIKKIK